MRDKQFLISEIEELLNVKICWHEQMADNGGDMSDKHREQAEIYSECFDFFESLTGKDLEWKIKNIIAQGVKKK